MVIGNIYIYIYIINIFIYVYVNLSEIRNAELGDSRIIIKNNCENDIHFLGGVYKFSQIIIFITITVKYRKYFKIFNLNFWWILNVYN